MRLSDPNNTAHIPYRDSKLTRLLRNAFEGNSKVVLICNITSSSSVFEETLSTLKFATRAKNIKQNAKKNEIVDEKMMLKKYEKEIKILQTRLKEVESILNKSENRKANRIKKSESSSPLLDESQNESRIDDFQNESRIDEDLQEKINVENELERAKAKILVSEKVSFNFIEVGLMDGKSQERRRNRISQIRDHMDNRRRFQSQVVDLNTVEKIRNLTNSFAEIPQAPVKIKYKEDVIIEKINEYQKSINYTGNLWELSVIISSDELSGFSEDTMHDKIEEYENYIKTLITQLAKKDDEIEMLKDELNLCRGNFNRLQKLLEKRTS